MYPFEYPRKLRHDADALPVSARGRFWADQVLSSPRDGAGWAALDVQVSPGFPDGPYREMVLAAADYVAGDPSVAADFVRVMGERQRELAGRLPESVYATIATRTLMDAREDGDARLRVVDWALARVDNPDVRLQAVMQAVDAQQGPRLEGLVQLTGQLSDTDVRSAVAERSAQRVEGQRQAARDAEVQRAARAAYVSRSPQIESDIRRQPEAEFERYALRDGLTLDNVGEFDMAGRWELLHAADHLLRARLGGEIDGLPPLVSAALERASAQRAAGMSFRDAGDWQSDTALDLHEELPARLAESPDEFWQKAAALSEVRQLDAAATSRHYTGWREGLIARRLRQQSEIAADDFAAPQLPSGVSEVRVDVEDGAVSYDSLDDLLADMRSYFVPSADGSMPTPVTGASRREAVGSAAAAAGQDRLNQGYDARNMDRLEAEIREWHGSAGSGAEPYVDGEALGGGEPYKYGPGLFTGHGIRVSKDDRGGVELRFSGGGYGPSGVSMLQEFAAFHDTSVRYGGPVELTYYVNLPDDIAARPLQRPDASRSDLLGVVAVPMPFDHIAGHIQELSGCTDAERLAVDAALRRSGHDPSGERNTATTKIGTAEISTGGYGSQFTYAEVDGKPASMQHVWASEGGSIRMLTPAVEVSVTFLDPQQHSLVASGLLSTRNHMNESHPAGHLGSRGHFTLNDRAAAALREQVGMPIAGSGSAAPAVRPKSARRRGAANQDRS